MNLVFIFIYSVALAIVSGLISLFLFNLLFEKDYFLLVRMLLIILLGPIFLLSTIVFLITIAVSVSMIASAIIILLLKIGGFIYSFVI